MQQSGSHSNLPELNSLGSEPCSLHTSNLSLRFEPKRQPVRRGLSFANYSVLYLEPRTNVTIECPQDKPFMPLHLYSNVNSQYTIIDRLATLTIIGCDVSTLPTQEDAATGPAPPMYSDDFFGESYGTLVLKKSRFLMSSAVCFFLGIKLLFYAHFLLLEKFIHSKS